MNPPQDQPRFIGKLAATLVVALAALRILVSFSPNLWWATDPRFDTTPPIGFGPLGAAVTDWLCVVALALAVFHSLRTARRVHFVLISLWLLGAAFAVYHGTIDAESLRIGGNWIGALALGLAAMHLGSHARLRRLLLASLVALTVPLAGQAIVQVTVEHKQTVKHFEQESEKVLREQGWEPGSSEARQYETRLLQNEASGRTGMANVFGSVAATLTLVAAGITLSIRRNRRSALFCALLTLLGMSALWLSFSRGAWVALVGVAFLFGVWKIAVRRAWSLAAVGVVAAAVLGVVLLGQAEPPRKLDARASMVFRYYYWQGAASMLLEERPLAGVGPGLFQDRYLLHKNPLSLEDVSDPHNLFVAYLSTLGLGGLAWCCLIVGWLWIAGRSVGTGATGRLGDPCIARDVEAPVAKPTGGTPQSGLGDSKPMWRAAVVAGLFVFALDYAVSPVREFGYTGLLFTALAAAITAMGVACLRGKIRTSNGEPLAFGRFLGVGILVGVPVVAILSFQQLGVWMVSGGAFVLVTGWLSGRAELDGPWARLGLFAAATAALLHAQIELSMTNMMAAPILMAVLGLAGANPDFSSQHRRAGWIAFGLVTCLFVVYSYPYMFGFAVQNMFLSGTAMSYREGSVFPKDFMLVNAVSSPNFQALRAEVQNLIDPETAKWHNKDFHIDPFAPIESEMTSGIRLAMLYNLESETALQLYEKTREVRYLRRAFEAAKHVLEHDPYNFHAHAEAGDIAWELGERDEARRLYRRALELNERAELIPDRQLQPKEVARINSRLTPDL